MKFLALASCYWRWDPCNLRCGCWKGFCLQQQGSAWFLGPKALGFFFGQVDSALDSNPGPGFFFWWVEPLDVGVVLVSPGGVLFVRSSAHLHQEDSVMVGGKIWFIL